MAILRRSVWSCKMSVWAHLSAVSRGSFRPPHYKFERNPIKDRGERTFLVLVVLRGGPKVLHEICRSLKLDKQISKNWNSKLKTLKNSAQRVGWQRFHFDLLKIFLAASVSFRTSHQGLRGQEEQRNRRTGKARAPSFQAAELQVHRYNQSPQTTLLVKRELSLAQKWWTLQDLQDWHHLHLLHPESGGQEETFHICQRHQGADHAKDLRADRLRTILRVHRREQGVGEEAEIEQILKRKPEQNQISGTAKEAMVRHRRNKEDARIQADAWRTGWKGSQTGVANGHTNGLERVSRQEWGQMGDRQRPGRRHRHSWHVWIPERSILLASQRRRGQGMELQNLRWIATKAYQTFNQEMIFYDYSARNTRIAMEIIAIENFRIDNEKETRFRAQ